MNGSIIRIREKGIDLFSLYITYCSARKLNLIKIIKS